MFVHWHWVRLRNGHWHLFVHLNDLCVRHRDVLDDVHGIGHGMRDFHGVRDGHFDGHSFRDPDLLRRQMVLAHERAQVLELMLLRMTVFMATALVAMISSSATVNSSPDDDAKRGHANDTEDLQRV